MTSAITLIALGSYAVGVIVGMFISRRKRDKKGRYTQ